MLNTTEFNVLAEKYKDMVFRLAYSYLKSQADADDVTQNVLISLYRTDTEFESELHARNWLAKVTVNECKKLLRRPFRRHESIEAYADTLKFEDKSYQELFTAVMGLEKSMRIIVLLYYYEGYRIKEIAELTSMPVGTVGTKLSRARAQLKKYLKEEV